MNPRSPAIGSPPMAKNGPIHELFVVDGVMFVDFFRILERKGVLTKLSYMLVSISSQPAPLEPANCSLLLTASINLLSAVEVTTGLQAFALCFVHASSSKMMRSAPGFLDDGDFFEELEGDRAAALRRSTNRPLNRIDAAPAFHSAKLPLHPDRLDSS